VTRVASTSWITHALECLSTKLPALDNPVPWGRGRPVKPGNDRERFRIKAKKIVAAASFIAAEKAGEI
jgi:hypothetical protein